MTELIRKEKKRLREEQDPLIQNLLDEVIDGLKRHGFEFTFEQGSRGDQTYTHDDSGLDLEIKISASISWEHVEVLPSFSINIALKKYRPITWGGGGLVLTRILETSDLGKVCPFYAEAIKPDSVPSLVACIVRIKQRWAEFHPKMRALASRHKNELDQLAKEAALTKVETK